MEKVADWFLGNQVAQEKRPLAASLESAFSSLCRPRGFFYSIFDRSILVFRISCREFKKKQNKKNEKKKFDLDVAKTGQQSLRQIQIKRQIHLLLVQHHGQSSGERGWGGEEVISAILRH